MENSIPKEIAKFLNEQTCVNIACIDAENQPYCFTRFFAFDEKNKCIYFKSSDNTHHAQLLTENGISAGTVLEDRLNKAFLKGLQFQAFVRKSNADDSLASKIYHKKFPMALVVPGDIWVVEFKVMKFTDNALGFGHKIHWKLED